MTSKNTARNQIPAIYRLAKKAGYWDSRLQGVDLGCGYDRLSQHLYDEEGVHCLGYDPEWKTEEQNRAVMDGMYRRSDFVTLSNVLNVIEGQGPRAGTLTLAHRFLRKGGALFVTVYEGDKQGRGGTTRDGWQENRRLKDYLSEVQEVFPNAKAKGGMIVATKD